MAPTGGSVNLTMAPTYTGPGHAQYIRVLLQITMGLLQIIGMKEILNNSLIALVIYPFNL